MMDYKTQTKQMLDFQKATFDNTFNALTMLQDQSERMANMFLEQTRGVPDEGRKAINEWIKAYKKGREDFKKAADESFNKVEDFFAEAEKPKSK